VARGAAIVRRARRARDGGCAEGLARVELGCTGRSSAP
jgi:hypothetical protein